MSTQNLGLALGLQDTSLVLDELVDLNISFLNAQAVDACDPAIWVYVSFRIRRLMVLPSVMLFPAGALNKRVILTFPALVPDYALSFGRLVLWEERSKW